MTERADDVQRPDEDEGNIEYGDTAPDDTVNEGQDEEAPTTGSEADDE